MYRRKLWRNNLLRDFIVPHHLEIPLRRMLISALGLAVALALAISCGNAEEGPKGQTLKEYKTSNVIDLVVSQAKLYCISDAITRFYTADPVISEPIVLAKNQAMILGKRQGITTMAIWDSANHVSCVEVRVSERSSSVNKPTPLQKDAMYEVSDLDSQSVDVLCDGLHLDATMRAGLHKQCVKSNQATTSLTADQQEERYEAIPAPPPPPQLPQPPTPEYFDEEGELLQKRIVYSKDAEINGPTGMIDIPVSQSTILQSTNRLTRVVCSDHLSVEPILLSQQDLALIGKSPGKTTLIITDESGASETLQLTVTKPDGHASINEPQPIPPVPNSPTDLKEFKVSQRLDLQTTQPKLLTLEHRVIRFGVADPAIALPVYISPTQIAAVGQEHGTTTLFLWDESRHRVGIDVNVEGPNKQWQQSQAPANQSAGNQDAPTKKARVPYNGQWPEQCIVRIWSGNKEDLLGISRSMDF